MSSPRRTVVRPRRSSEEAARTPSSRPGPDVAHLDLQTPLARPISNFSKWPAALAYAILYNVVMWIAVGLSLLTPDPFVVGSSIFGFFIGAVVGSFACQAAYRIPRGINLDDPPSNCPDCGASIRWKHNIPILGWFLSKGRCYRCRKKISWRYPLVETVVAVAFCLVFLFIAHFINNSSIK
jgi:Bacterial Peptidase A24 N-terminal domain